MKTSITFVKNGIFCPLKDVTVDVLPPIACHRGTVAVSFGLRRMLNSMVNARDSRFILVQALDRRSSNDPTSSRRFAFCVGLIMKCYVVQLLSSLSGALPSFILLGGQSPSRFTMRFPSRIT